MAAISMLAKKAHCARRPLTLPLRGPLPLPAGARGCLQDSDMFLNSSYMPLILGGMSKLVIKTEVDIIPDVPRKGRGAVTNRPSGRFDSPDRVNTDDGWGGEPEEWENAPFQTVLGIDTAKKIITRNQSPDIGFDRSINPYKGCEHGCIYCFARPTHAYLNLSPGLDFETKIFRKPDAPELLRQELSHPRYKPAAMVLGIN